MRSEVTDLSTYPSAIRAEEQFQPTEVRKHAVINAPVYPHAHLTTSSSAPIVALLNGRTTDRDVIDWAWSEALIRQCPLRVFSSATHGIHEPEGCVRIPIGIGPDLARAHNASLVVAGESDSAGIAEVVLGDEADSTAPSWSTPVVCIPENPIAVKRDGFHTVVVGVDGTENSAAALLWTAVEAKRRGIRVQAILSWTEEPLGTTSGAVLIDKETNHLPGRAATNRVRQIVHAALGETHSIAYTAQRCSPVSTLIRAAKEADLLVIGAGKRQLHGHRTLGPTTQECLHRSPIPVAIVPWTPTDLPTLH